MNILALIRQTAAGVQAQPDRSGVEAALRFRNSSGGQVKAVCLGGEASIPLLREAVAMGCDSALLVRDPNPGGSGPSFGSICLADAIRRLDYDIIFASCYAVDADAIQTGLQLAERLHLPQASYVKDASLSTDGRLRARRQLEDRYQLLELPLPCLISAIPHPNLPIYPTADGITRAYATEIPSLSPSTPVIGEPARLLESHARKERKRGTILIDYLTEPYTQALVEAIRHVKPSIVLIGSTANGMDLAPRVAARIGAGLVTDCTGLSIHPDSGYLLTESPDVDGIHTNLYWLDGNLLQMATVRPGVLKNSPNTSYPNRSEEPVHILDINLDQNPQSVHVISTSLIQDGSDDITQAKVLAAGGRGIGGPDGFEDLRTIAVLLGGTVACSRACVEAG